MKLAGWILYASCAVAIASATAAAAAMPYQPHISVTYVHLVHSTQIYMYRALCTTTRDD